MAALLHLAEANHEKILTHHWELQPLPGPPKSGGIGAQTQLPLGGTCRAKSLLS